MTQGELVFQAVSTVFGINGKLTDAVPNTKAWTKQQLDDVHALVLIGFQNGSVNKNSGGSDEVALKKYVPGLVNNWVRKDGRMNGGVKYAPLNPGSRTGSSDEKLKNLKLLFDAVPADVKPTVQVEIDKRIEELKPKPQVINAAAIPESLRLQLEAAYGIKIGSDGKVE